MILTVCCWLSVLVFVICVYFLWIVVVCVFVVIFFFQAEDGIRDLVRSRGLGDVYKRQKLYISEANENRIQKNLKNIKQVEFSRFYFSSPYFKVKLIGKLYRTLTLRLS